MEELTRVVVGSALGQEVKRSQPSLTTRADEHDHRLPWSGCGPDDECVANVPDTAVGTFSILAPRVGFDELRSFHESLYNVGMRPTQHDYVLPSFQTDPLQVFPKHRGLTFSGECSRIAA